MAPFPIHDWPDTLMSLKIFETRPPKYSLTRSRRVFWADRGVFWERRLHEDTRHPSTTRPIAEGTKPYGVQAPEAWTYGQVRTRIGQSF